MIIIIVILIMEGANSTNIFDKILIGSKERSTICREATDRLWTPFPLNFAT